MMRTLRSTLLQRKFAMVLIMIVMEILMRVFYKLFIRMPMVMVMGIRMHRIRLVKSRMDFLWLEMTVMMKMN